MYQAKVFNGDWIDKTKLIFPRPVEIFNNVILFLPPTGAFRVLTAFSEPELFRVSNDAIIKHQDMFDLILASDEEIINSCKNSLLFPFGTSWIDYSFAQNVDPMKKKFEASFLCGAKRSTQGHILRHNLWYRQKEIKIPKTFWISGVLPIENIDNNPTLLPELCQKKMLFNCQFHIAIENLKINNYFTEKLIDCFHMRTIPIYWGCPNVAKYFDIDGIYAADNEQEIIDICNSLTPEQYFSRLDSIEHNFKECLKYCEEISVRLQKVISDIFFYSSSS
jgi:hypothetical protein